MRPKRSGIDKAILPLILAVLDTNVLVSALCLPGSLPAELLRRWLAWEFILILSESILAELADVLARPKFARRYAMTPEKAQAFTGILWELATVVPGEMVVEAVPADPRDNHVIACAVEGGANIIVSGDRHLKDMGAFDAIRILSPAQFRDFLLEAQEVILE